MEAENSSQNEIEVSVRDTDQLYRDIVEKAGIAIVIDDLAGNIIFYNKEFSQMFGYSGNDTDGLSYYDLIHPEDRERIKSVSGFRQGSKPPQLQYEFRARNKDGSDLFVEVSSLVIKDAGKIIGNKYYIWDITERKFAEKQWQKAKEDIALRLRYEEGISSASATLLSNTEDSMKMALQYLMNAFRAEKVYFMQNILTPDDKLLMKSIATVNLNSPYEDNTFPCHQSYSYDENLLRWKETLSGGEIIFGKADELPDEEKVVINPEDITSLLLIPVFSRAGWFGFLGFNNIDFGNDLSMESSLFQTAAGLLGSYIDRLNAEEMLKTAKEEAEELSRMKSQFLANVSHEIRTPMNGIIGFSEIILNSESLDEIHEKARAIVNESESLLLLINEILDHTKIEAGKTELEERTVNLYKILEEIADVIRVQTDAKGIEFRLEIAPEIPSFIICDKLRLRQVIMNLTTNAVKFTSEGYVLLKVQSAEITEDTADLMFSVIDTGIGIPKEKQTNIFDSYNQADGSITRKYGGTGLGTTISKQIVELMGGIIGIESEPGEGSIFWFRVKFRISDPVSNGNEDLILSPDIKETLLEERKTRVSRILVVDDYPPNLEVATIHLEGAGHKTDTAENGMEAIEKCRSQKYDLVLMDLQMPEMDGLTAATIIRNEIPDYQDIPLIALTANADDETRQKCISKGLNDILAKPIRRNLFLETVDKWLFLTEQEETVNQETDKTEKFLEINNIFEKPPMDYDVALDEFGDPEIVEDVATHFIQNVEKQIPIMRDAIENKDFERLRREAHSIKGGAASLEALPLSNKAKIIELMCKNEDYENLSLAFEDLFSDFNKLKNFITQLFI